MSAAPTSGRFITLEGGEGAGKSTQIERLAERLIACGVDVVTTREPGGSVGAEEIRHLLVTGDPGRWTPLTEALLNYAARNDHLNKTIRPALDDGAWVLCDRFADSTRAYQGSAESVPSDAIEALDAMVVGTNQPDLTLILDLPVEVGLARATHGARGDENRFERMGKTFHEHLRNAFLDIAKAHPKRCKVISASGTPDEVADAIWAAVLKKFRELTEKGAA
jgi:dTMP kinase